MIGESRQSQKVSIINIGILAGIIIIFFEIVIAWQRCRNVVVVFIMIIIADVIVVVDVRWRRLWGCWRARERRRRRRNRKVTISTVRSVQLLLLLLLLPLVVHNKHWIGIRRRWTGQVWRCGQIWRRGERRAGRRRSRGWTLFRLIFERQWFSVLFDLEIKIVERFVHLTHDFVVMVKTIVCWCFCSFVACWRWHHVTVTHRFSLTSTKATAAWVIELVVSVGSRSIVRSFGPLFVERLLVTLVWPNAFVGEPLSHLFCRDVGVLGQNIGHVLVRIGIVLILDEPLAQHVHHLVRKESIRSTTGCRSRDVGRISCNRLMLLLMLGLVVISG